MSTLFTLNKLWPPTIKHVLVGKIECGEHEMNISTHDY